MSRLEQMIKELCPEGVQFSELGEVCEIKKGIQFNKTDMNDEGSYPVINGGINPSGYIEQYNQNENTITISQGGASAGYVNWIETKFWAGAHCYILIPKDNLDNRYLYHFVKSYEKKLQECQYGAGIPALAKSTVEKLNIPMPPLSIQKEIVRILDNFTNLTAELESELEARKKQYEYYRDKLLDFGTAENERGGVTFECEWKKIGDICNVSRGKVISKDYIKDNQGIYPVYSSQTENNGILGYISNYEYEGEYLTWTTDGANAGTVFYRIGKFNITNVCGLLKLIDDKILLKYVFYVLSILAPKYVSEGMGNPKLMSNTMSKISIPIPPLSEQERIVAILDRFDKLCNDISEGLPAEIEARKKQYEYYRDRLLSFKER